MLIYGLLSIFWAFAILVSTLTDRQTGIIMSAFVIANFNVQDENKLKQYGAAAAATLDEFGGQYLAKGKTDILHGGSIHPMTVVIQFPDKESANSWYQSDDYQKLLDIRNEAMDGDFQLVG